MVRWFLFSTRVGDLILYLFEEWTWLFLVDRKDLLGLGIEVER